MPSAMKTTKTFSIFHVDLNYFFNSVYIRTHPICFNIVLYMIEQSLRTRLRTFFSLFFTSTIFSRQIDRYFMIGLKCIHMLRCSFYIVSVSFLLFMRQCVLHVIHYTFYSTQLRKALTVLSVLPYLFCFFSFTLQFTSYAYTE